MRDSGRDEVGIAARVGPGLGADCELDSTGENHAPLVSVRVLGHGQLDPGLVEKDLTGIRLKQPTTQALERQVGRGKMTHKRRKA